MLHLINWTTRDIGLNTKKWCPVEEREVPYSELKKGYEVSKDNYVVLEKEDLEGIKLKTNNTIDVKEFIESGVQEYQAKHILYLSRY